VKKRMRWAVLSPSAQPMFHESGLLLVW